MDRVQRRYLACDSDIYLAFFAEDYPFSCDGGYVDYSTQDENSGCKQEASIGPQPEEREINALISASMWQLAIWGERAPLRCPAPPYYRVGNPLTLVHSVVDVSRQISMWRIHRIRQLK